jgi:hypothetical protein
MRNKEGAYLKLLRKLAANFTFFCYYYYCYYNSYYCSSGHVDHQGKQCNTGLKTAPFLTPLLQLKDEQ